ncbi:sensor histidine kinase [Nocardia callitridis]|uniref:sensor histidine kinase n=1 Tax=Nocardia callitridis TaxID=648753 RepID=UPI0031F0461B
MARDAIGALAAFLAGVALYVAGLSIMTEAGEDVPLTVRLAILAAISATTVLRRRMPLCGLFIGLIPLAVDTWIGPSIPVWVIYTDLIYAAALYSSRRASRAMLVSWSVFSAVVVLLTLLTGDLHAVSLAILAVFLFIATPLWWATSVRTHKEIANAERARAQALTLVADLDRRAAVADERTTMARDLHDVIAGHLSAIAIHSEAALGVLEKRRADAADVEVDGIVRSIRSNSVSALQEMRTMIGLLQDDSNAERQASAPRRLAQLPNLVDAARSAGIEVSVDTALADAPLPSAVDQAAYRIVQEALTNAMKHAPGQGVAIEVRIDGALLGVSVRNPLPVGSARAAATDRPRGLINMRERTAALGGSFTAGANAHGWEVRAELPLRAGMA